LNCRLLPAAVQRRVSTAGPVTMSDEKPSPNSNSKAEADESALSQPATPDHETAPDGPVASYSREQEARVVRKLDWNLMTLFFVLCEC
jgi:hypothetical protein